MLQKFLCVSLAPHTRLAVLAGLPVFILRTGQAPNTPPRREKGRDMRLPDFYIFYLRPTDKCHTTIMTNITTIYNLLNLQFR